MRIFTTWIRLKPPAGFTPSEYTRAIWFTEKNSERTIKDLDNGENREEKVEGRRGVGHVHGALTEGVLCLVVLHVVDTKKSAYER